MGNGARLLVALGAVALAVALFFVFRPTDDDGENGTTAAQTTTEQETTTEGTEGTTEETTTTAPPPPPSGPQEVRVDIPAGGPTEVQRANVDLGERVTLVVRSAEISDHVHLHGYDLIADVAPGQPARITFRASRPGRFEAELEDRGTPILDLRVTP